MLHSNIENIKYRKRQTVQFFLAVLRHHDIIVTHGKFSIRLFFLYQKTNENPHFFMSLLPLARTVGEIWLKLPQKPKTFGFRIS